MHILSKKIQQKRFWVDNIDYSDEEIMDAVLIFSHILGNRFKKSSDISIEWAVAFGNEIRELTKKYTWVDTKTFYK